MRSVSRALRLSFAMSVTSLPNPSDKLADENRIHIHNRMSSRSTYAISLLSRRGTSVSFRKAKHKSTKA